jgi:NADPH2:quinone reductase
MRGKYTGIRLKYPFTPGWEGSGTVVAVGPGMLNQFLLNKRVSFMKQGEMGTYKIGGAMADYCVTDNKAVIPLGDDFSFEQASSFFVNPLTAIAMVERCKELGSKATIVTAAASQIGRMILPLLIMSGITPICTVRKEDQAELLRAALGERYGKYVVNTSKPSF